MRVLCSKTVLLWACGLLLLACEGLEGPLPAVEVTPGQSAQAGPVVARVGDWELRVGEVDVLATAALALRSRDPWRLPAPPTETFEQRLGLAIELLSLAGAAHDGGLPAQLVRDSHARALAGTYLDRLREKDDKPISAEDLQVAHQAEIRTYMTTGESDLYAPTRIDLAIIGVGLFPTWSRYEDDRFEPVLTDEQTFALASRIRAACGDRVADLDAFEQIATRFSAGNPTVRIEHHARSVLDPALFPLAPQIRTALEELDGPGAISQPVRTPGGVFIVRRGVLRPGKGEELASIEDALRERVQRERLQRLLADHLSTLLARVPVKTWPEHLGDQVPEAHGP